MHLRKAFFLPIFSEIGVLGDFFKLNQLRKNVFQHEIVIFSLFGLIFNSVTGLKYANSAKNMLLRKAFFLPIFW